VPAGLDAADPLLAELKTSGSKLGLDRTKASAVVALHAKVSAAQDAQLAAMHEGWQQAAKADEEIGGDNFQVAMADARSALREFGTPELHRVLGAFNLGVHPEIVRLLARVSRELHRARSL
jgi:hypothetical protein